MSLLRLMNNRSERGTIIRRSVLSKNHVIEWTDPADVPWTYTKPVSAQALARVNAIYDEASALG